MDKQQMEQLGNYPTKDNQKPNAAYVVSTSYDAASGGTIVVLGYEVKGPADIAKARECLAGVDTVTMALGVAASRGVSRPSINSIQPRPYLAGDDNMDEIVAINHADPDGKPQEMRINFVIING